MYGHSQSTVKGGAKRVGRITMWGERKKRDFYREKKRLNKWRWRKQKISISD